MNNISYVECTNLTDIEKQCINIYTASAYMYINTFLQGIDTIPTYLELNKKSFVKYFKFIINHSNNVKTINIVNNKINKEDIE